MISKPKKKRNSRDKGQRGERELAEKLRVALPQYADQIRRSVQSRGAEESDIAGVPGFWVENQYADKPDPIKKLLQAERDVLAAKSDLIPIAVTRKTRGKETNVTMRYGNLVLVAESLRVPPTLTALMPVTVGLEWFLPLLSAYVAQF